MWHVIKFRAMARTRLFARLSSLLAREKNRLAAERDKPSPAFGLSRREFLQRSLLGLAAFSELPSLSACSDDSAAAGRSTRAGSKNARVVIVGGGMAGLTCAYRLQQADIRATVYEASKRTGGRMYSTRMGLLDGQLGELGGEFIDTGHLTLHALAEELEITLDDRDALLGPDVAGELWWVDGRAVAESTLVEQFSRVAPRISELVTLADDDADDSVFVRLDNTPLSVWLEQNLTDEPELKSVLASAYRGEYGRELDQQSALNLIYLIGADAPDPFRIFGESDERFHSQLGNQTFPDTLSGLLTGQIELDRKLVAAQGNASSGYQLTFEDVEGGQHEVTADQLVFALPFSTLRKVDLSKLTLSDDKRTVIDELGYGTNAKVLAAFKRRSWLADHQASGSVTCDEAFQQVWDSSVGQAGQAGVLTNFLGGKAGEQLSGSADAWIKASVLPAFEQMFPGASADYADSAVLMHWPSQPFTQGSYGCYLPGQWSFYGTEGLPENADTLHFCGEHTSLEFQGYMEGAADTGSLVAGAILDVLGVAPGSKHAALLSVRRSVPQPFFAERVVPSARATRQLALRRATLALLAAGGPAHA